MEKGETTKKRAISIHTWIGQAIETDFFFI